MDAPYTIFIETLRKSGFSLTKPRKLIFQVLDSNEPLSITEIHKACQNKLDRVTVYRTVELFEKLKIVERINIGWKYKVELLPPFQLHHHHMSCIRCRKTFALPEDTILEARLKELAAMKQFTPTEHQLELRGICQSCANT